MGWRFASDRLVVERFFIPERRVVWRLVDRRTVGILSRRHSLFGELRNVVVNSLEGKKVK
jgi:hypothetical protein